MTELLLSHGPVLGYLGIAVFLMLTGAGFPLPEEVFARIRSRSPAELGRRAAELIREERPEEGDL